MSEYTLSIITFDVPIPQDFAAPSDHDALWFARGFIAGFIGHNPAAYVGSEWRIDLTPRDGVFEESTQFGRCVVEEIDGDVGQSWTTWRWPRSGPDMNVGDPHDDDTSPSTPSPGPLRKRASGSKSR